MRHADPTSRPSTHPARLLGRHVVFDIHGESAGSRRETVVLLHGIPGSRHSWDGVAQHLASSFRVVVPDLLGFGDSAEPGDDFHADGQAAVVHALLGQLAVDRAHVVGFDFGGPIAVALYAAAPERFRSLTLIATNLFTDTPIPGPLRLAPVPVVGPLLFRLAFGRIGLAGMWLAATRQRRRFPLRRFWRSIASRTTVRWTRRVFFESMRDLAGRYALVARTVAEVRVPTLVVWADHDPFFPAREGERLARAVPSARFELLADTGHFVPEEQPEALGDLLHDHFRRASASHGPEAPPPARAALARR